MAYVALSLSLGYGISFIAQTLLICRPITCAWGVGKTCLCGSQAGPVLAWAILNMVTDIITLILPIPMIWRLQMRRGKKVALIAIFGLGFG
jgi:hypothetical protein